MKPVALLLILSGLAGAEDWLPKLHAGGKLDAAWATAGSTKPDMFLVHAQGSKQRTEPKPATFFSLKLTSS